MLISKNMKYCYWHKVNKVTVSAIRYHYSA